MGSTDEEKKAMRQRLEDFGKFISMFSQAENSIARFLAWRAGLDEPTAKALLSGVRVDAAISMIRRLYEARTTDIEPSLDKCLKQLAAINGIRNDLVHYGADFSLEVPIVTTERAAHIPTRIRETAIASGTFADLTLDLVSIILLLGAMVGNDGLDAKKKHLADVVRHTDRAWLYKSPQPKSNDRKNRDKPPKQPRLQKPSEA